VFLPVGLFTYRKMRGERTVRCPETGRAAFVDLDARHGVLTSLYGPPDVRVADCSRWPEHAHCAQSCRDQLLH
jgi:hypothetical protein